MLLIVWLLIALACGIMAFRRATDSRGLGLVMGLLLGPLGLWLFPRRSQLNTRPIIIVCMGISALFLFSCLLVLLRSL